MGTKGWQRILLLIIPYFFVVGLFQLIGMLVAKAPINQYDVQKTLLQSLIILIFNAVGTITIIFLFVKFIDNEKFIQIGLTLENRFKDIFASFIIGFLSVSGGFLILIMTKEIEIVRIVLNPQKIIISVIMFCIIALSEEILIRGYILKNLLLSCSNFLSLVISSLIFTLMHLFNPHLNLTSLISLFLVGLMLGLLYIYTKNLWPSIFLHFSWNFFQTNFGFNVSGENSYSLIEFIFKKSTLLNGGEFGFEGSILSIISEILIICALIFYHDKIFSSFRSDKKLRGK